MKLLNVIFCLLIISTVSQAQHPSKNVLIITLDGTRWNEIFGGADGNLLFNPQFVRDTSLMKQQYWHTYPEERRRLLMPFFWSVIARQGQLLGNRLYNNDVNVANLYKISYPGYSEIFTGYADKLFIPNLSINNKRTNILQYLNNQQEFKGKVAAFCSWRVLPFILDEKNGTMQVNAGYEPLYSEELFSKIIDSVQLNVHDKNNTRHDLLTFESAKNYLESKHPKVLYIGLGETDEFAHKGDYDTYLQKMHNADAMIAELWYYVQTDPFYRNNTAMVITTDHGRGRKPDNWSKHGFWINGSGETWMAMLGCGIEALGEVKVKQQVFQKQVAPTIAALLGQSFVPGHQVAAPLHLQAGE